MAMTNAERQQRYRKRGLLTRLQVMIDPGAAANLEKVCRLTGSTKRQAVEQAINELARSLDSND